MLSLYYPASRKEGIPPDIRERDCEMARGDPDQMLADCMNDEERLHGRDRGESTRRRKAWPIIPSEFPMGVMAPWTSIREALIAP